MMSQWSFKLLAVFLSLIAIIAPIAEGRRMSPGNGHGGPPSRTAPKIPKCGPAAARCKTGTPSCSGTRPVCSQGGEFIKCTVPLICA
ncbi:uncharacterized protein MELLADRAFT_124482 [Melampsora larici-populina 98AG31]|uniref:Secreted protein n=1 Tax=Melampsora larici-populina (strain 98AG31 / pathotype 3-4-7) TaxID=747676 RepID=F4RSD3_MELLP|nr:uncharacterized protein MELLADRAFT_124482 [Melampsora larici-populina 98AG31]EGG04579.1 secreted protein [Melampsora larici-populina 98AG31]